MTVPTGSSCAACRSAASPHGSMHPTVTAAVTPGTQSRRGVFWGGIMAPSGESEPMLSPADDAVRAYLRESMIALVATRSPKGHPFLTPLWFVDDGGALYITTGPETWAGRNVAEHPEVTLLFRSDRQPRSDRVLRVRGRAVCHRGLPSWRVLLRAAGKYYVSPRALPVE